MKLRYLLVLWSLCCANWAQAEIYKRIDADGHVTYSSTPLKGAKKLHLEPLPTLPPPPRTRGNEGAADFPRVNSATQKDRDNTRRQILEDELATEEKALAEARRDWQDGAENPETYTGKDGKVYRNVAKQDEKMGGLQEQVQMHEKNIEALKTELSKRNK
ncbi:MAG: DUF4124 domain-containing protein [Gallionellaceae bacterium]|nr:MAG: DUF4124 domain-containing protein [Gallionellaceae bacterium]